MNEILWRQKSGLSGLRGGECYTRFFHRMPNLWRKSTFMSALVVDRNCVDTIEDMKFSIHGLYIALLVKLEP